MSEHITHTQGIKRLERSSSDRMLAGVSGGLGRYFDLNPAFFRLGFVVLTVLGGAGILTYLAAVLVIPEEGAEQSIAARVLAERRQRPWPMVGLGLVGAALLVLLSRSTFWPVAGAGWVIVLIAGLAILWTYDAGHGTRPGTKALPRAPRARRRCARRPRRVDRLDLRVVPRQPRRRRRRPALRTGERGSRPAVLLARRRQAQARPVECGRPGPRYACVSASASCG